MKREFEELYQSKLTTAEEAVKIVKSGDRVYGGTASSGGIQMVSAAGCASALSGAETIASYPEWRSA